MAHDDKSLGGALASAAPAQDDLGAELLRVAIRRAVSGVALPAPTLGRFQIRAVLGRGAMGVVYDAWDPRLERRVALKVIRCGDREEARLLDEARACAKLNHPNVIVVYDAERIDDSVVIALERIDGPDLRRYLAVQRPSWRVVLRLLVPCGRGLAVAHDAGIVHRDIKPENILVGSDGRTRIGDFGLARPSDLALDRSGPAGSTGAGTPAYMAPEQHLGSPGDPRSDQYSFCLTLNEALGGRGTEVLAPGAPFQLRSVLARGLSEAPAQRYPDMTELSSALERARNAPRRRLQLGAGVLLVAVGGLAAVSLPSSHDTAAQSCESAFANPREVWNDGRRADLQRAFAASGSPIASEAAEHTIRQLDAFPAALESAVRATCRLASSGTPIRDLRLLCLERAVRRVDTFVELLRAADADLVRRAPAAAASMTDLERCDDAVALVQAAPEPTRLLDRAVIAALRAGLDRAAALDAAGHYRDGLAVARSLLPVADSLGYGPLLAEIHYQIGVLERSVAEVATAERSFRRALFAAEAAGNDILAASAWIRLLATARANGRYDDATHNAEQARAKLSRLGNPPAVDGFLHNNLAALALERGDPKTALDELKQVVRLYEPLGVDRPRFVGALTTLSIVYDQLGERALAADSARRALQIAERMYGPNHPDLQEVLRAVANAELHAGRIESSQAILERALRIAERSYGTDHEMVAVVLNDLAGGSLALGDLERARAHMSRALEIRQKALGPDHPRLVPLLMNLARTTINARPRDALQLLAQAEAILRTRKQDDRASLSLVLENRGLAQRAIGQLDAAIASHRQALELARAQFGSRHPRVSMTTTSLAEALLANNRPADAKTLLEPALVEDGRDAVDHAHGVFVLARAMWRLGQRDRARALAEAARATYLAAEGAQAKASAAEVAAWLAAPR